MSTLLRSLLRRFWSIISAVSVRVKILGMVLGLVLLLGFGVTWQVRNSLSYILQAQLDSQSVTVARDLAARAADPILLNDLVGLQKLLLETQENNLDLRYAFIVDKYGQVLVHTFESGFPLALLNLNHVAPNEHHRTLVLQTENGLVWDTAVPIFAGRAGIVRIGLSDVRLRENVQILTVQLLLMVVLVSALGVLVATLLTFILTRPLRELVSATQQVAQGDFSPRVPRWADDEIGDLAEAFNAMTAELARADEIRREREQLRRQLLEKTIAAQEDERRRIARELHDSTSQNLTSLMVGLKNIETICQDPRLRSTVDELRGVASKTLDEVHEISTRLRPRILDDLGLPEALERLAHDWQTRYKIPVDVVIHIGQERLPGAIETAIYRIVQESLTNIARYAKARSVSVLVERRGGQVIAIIEDDGQGFDLTQEMGDRHLGLVGMRERAELLGGKLTIESQPGKGTSVHVQIHVPPLPLGEGASPLPLGAGQGEGASPPLLGAGQGEGASPPLLGEGQGESASPLPLGEGQGEGASPLPLGEGQGESASPLPLGEGQGKSASPPLLGESQGEGASPLPLGEGQGESASPLPLGESQGEGASPLPLGEGQGEGKP